MMEKSELTANKKSISQVRIYTPESSIKRPDVLMGEMWRDMKEGQGLAWRLAVRDIQAMYRQSFLGIMWAFLLPLANTLTWLFLRGSGVVSMGETGMPYIVYVFSGTMLWAVFMEGVQMPLQKVMGSRSMMAKVNFPREALILSSIYQSFFSSGIKFVLIVLGLVGLGHFNLTFNLLAFPLGLVSLIVAGNAIGLLLTPLGLLYTDIGKGLPIILQFLMYLTPVVFPMPQGGWMAAVVKYNPITPLVMVTREWLTGVPSQSLTMFMIVTIGFCILFFLAWIVFRVAMPMILERLSS